MIVLLLVTACAAEPADRLEVERSELSTAAIARGSAWRYWDRGGDLGSPWRGSFDDASWASGAGPLGYGETYLGTTVGYGPSASSKYPTTYFRRTFTVDDPAAVAALTGEVMYDDGVVVYLNGTEIGRSAMPTGTIVATTRSTGHEANNAYQAYDWTAHAGLLIAGTNVLAVEVHQLDPASSDLVFDAALTMEVAAPPPPPPGDAEDVPRNATWWYWDNGGSLGTAWRTLGGASTGWDLGVGPLGYGESYLRTTIGYGPSASSRYPTAYFRHAFTIDDPAAVTALAGEVMYDDGFVVYLNGTEIGRDAMPGGTVTAGTLSTGHEAGNAYQRYDWTAHRGLLVAGPNVIAIEVHQSSPSSSDLVFDASLTVEADAPPPPPVDFGGVVRNGFWHYWDNGGSPDAAWKLQTWGRDGWDWGYGVFGYGESYLTTTVSAGADPANKPVTTYFTTTFYATNPSAVTAMIAEVMYDDGFVAYLNGIEVARRAMPVGAVTATTLSSVHEAGNAYERLDLAGARGLLVFGTNVLAVEVHQASRASSDLVFDLALTLTGEAPPPPSGEEDIARRAVWRFWDRREAPSEYDSWADPDFNDAVWGSGAGPLGYGESYLATTLAYGSDPANKPVTAYARRWFTVDAPSAQTTLLAELMYDDGVVVHLNGQEVLTLHMPVGQIGHTTTATGHETGNTYEVHDLSAFSGLLVPGPNLLAVEVHQASPSSSDLVFDLALQVDTPLVCAVPGGGPAVPPAPSTGLGDVWVGPTTVVAVGGHGAVGRRTDAGGAWCWAVVDAATSWQAVWGSADDDVWLVGTDGAVVHFDGASFTPVDVGATAHLMDIWGTGPDDIWIVGMAGTVRHFDGVTWASFDLAANQSMLAVWSATVDDVWISGTEPAPYPGDPTYDGSSGIIYRWVPATATWNLELRNTVYYGSGSFAALHGSSVNDIWAVGSQHPAGAACSISGLRRFDGTTWANVAGAPTECSDLNDVAAGAPGAADGAWVVGGNESGWDASGTSRYAGGTWTSYPGDATVDDLTAIDHLADRMWAVGFGYHDGYHQKIIRWDGAGWIQEW